MSANTFEFALADSVYTQNDPS